MLQTIFETVRGELGFTPYIALYCLLELPFGAKATDWTAVRRNLLYWPVWVGGNVVTALLLDAVGRPHLLAWAHRHAIWLPTGHVHPALSVLLGLFAFDVFYYWFHRLQHTRALWPQHAVHHADTAINATTAYRHHFLENLIRVPIVDLPLMFIFVDAAHRPGVSVPELVLVAFLAHLGIFAHANLRVGFGPLSWIIVSPQLHRLHHSIEPRHWGTNFAAYFPILDVVFGTYRRPSRDEWPDTGVPELGDSLSNPIRMSAHPFKAWATMIRRQGGRGGVAEPVVDKAAIA